MKSKFKLAAVVLLSGLLMTGAIASTPTLLSNLRASIVRAESQEGTITFGNNGLKITSSNVSGADSLGNVWSISSQGTSSFTQQPNYSQVGKSKEPATSITFSVEFPSATNFSNISAKFGGFSGTAGDVLIKLDGRTVKTGSLNETSDVTVESTGSMAGTVLSVEIGSIAKGVKCYFVSYTIGESVDPSSSSVSSASSESSSGEVTTSEETQSSEDPTERIIAELENDVKTSNAIIKYGEDSFEGKKCGTTDTSGSAKAIFPANTNNVVFYAASWRNTSDIELTISDGEKTFASVVLDSDYGVTASSPYTLTQPFANYKFSVDLVGITEETTLVFAASDRFVIWNVGYTIAEAPVDPSEAALNNIKKLDTAYSLKYSYNSETKAVSNIKLRYGALIEKKDWEKIENKVTEFGVVAIKTDDIDESYDNLRDGLVDMLEELGKEDPNSTMADAADMLDASIVSSTDTSDVAETTQEEIEYVLFNGVTSVPSLKYKNVAISAVAYVKVNGKYEMLKEVSYGVETIAEEYLANPLTPAEAKESLQAIVDYVVA